MGRQNQQNRASSPGCAMLPRIAVGVLAMLVVALSSDLPAFQESDPHPVDGKTQIFQAGNQAGQQAAKSETDAKLSKAIEAAQEQQTTAPLRLMESEMPLPQSEDEAADQAVEQAL